MVQDKLLHNVVTLVEILLEAWPVWARRTGCVAGRSLTRARRTLEDAMASLGASTAALSWPSAVSGRGA